MANLKLNIIVLSVLTVLLSACNKYEEGSNFSLISAKKRIEGKWKLTKYTLNGNDWNQDLIDNSYDFKKDGSFTATAYYGVSLQNITLSGTWELSNDKTVISLSYGDTYTIVKLTKKELKLQRIIGSSVYQSTFESVE
jgi:hypothetical protein